MKPSSIDTILEVRLRHEPGTLARVATAIAEHQGLLCEIVTVRIGDEYTQREITVETDTDEQVRRIIAAIKVLPGAEVISIRDRVMEAHRSGKVRVTSRLPLETVRDLRTIVVAAAGRPGLIAPDRIRRGQIVFVLSNPDPEIEPKAALAAGAALASDGRAINNALAFPSLVRAAIETRARTITVEMMIEAARVIARHAEAGELVPSPLDRSLHDAITEAIACCAIETGAANTASP